MKLLVIALVVNVFFAVPSKAQTGKPAVTPRQALLSRHMQKLDPSQMEMNGIRLKDYEGFEKNWKFVTVRYRKDSTEMRYTYANDLAWKALTSGEKYPDGAVFAKIGVITEEDPSFASSVVPMGAIRYQFMVRDEKKCKHTDGWCYALFGGLGVALTNDVKTEEMACAACHKIVPERQYVFSQVAPLTSYMKQVQEKAAKAMEAILPPVPVDQKAVQFKTISASDLPEDAQRFLSSKQKKVRDLVGPLKESAFEGTLNEMLPNLIKEALATNQPAIFTTTDQKYFTMAFPDHQRKTPCNDGMHPIAFVETVWGSPSRRINLNVGCYGK
ncbi:hypothetical protein AZI85_13275 [Bdellovibrio bacteriovorus]|uniref:Cytochrome P460 domain-containing protein n=1 Tax=Bdellovibrio bacteriovorus TaxID=959 RepID=A0A150WBY7_BDEBC|nr:cytochrome P460 family protein [Bdellovibrio bacteriovorus]KYG60433.1 hypothetical protein AZI85_13275 [Bdellovibrio bacteriovorus]